MPTINIPPRLRFTLYLIGVIGAVLVQYASDKSWFGDAEMRLWSGVAAVLFALAAAKTSTSDNTAVVTGTVISETGETGAIEATIGAPGSEQHVTVNLAADASEFTEKMRRASDYDPDNPPRTH